MRMSRVLLAGVAVAGVAASTSAFTDSNDVQDSIAGYGTATVTGAETTHINYVLDSSDKSLVDDIVFELDGDYTDAVTNQGLKAWLRLHNDNSAIGSPFACDFGPAANGLTPVTCTVTDEPLTSFDGVALTVAE